MGKSKRRTGGSSARSRRAQIKDAQLCTAVAETVSLVLAGSDSDLLLSAYVMEVLPAPDASRLLVRVEVPPDLDLDAVHDALTRALPLLRDEIASSVARKKTPTLLFEVRPAGLQA